MSLDKLDYVLALAEERNLTRAARKAFISQPTLTNYINRLEEQLGVKLFDRSVTPIEITRAGALYIEQMKKIQLAETNLRNELRILGSMETVFHLGVGAIRRWASSSMNKGRNSWRTGCVRDASSAIPICPPPGSSVPWDWERSLSPGRSLNAPSPADRNASPSAPCSSRSIPALRWRLTVRKIPGLPSAGRPLP